MICNKIAKTVKGNELDTKNSSGILCIKQPWPGMGRTINGDHKRFLETYLQPFPGNPKLILKNNLQIIIEKNRLLFYW